MTDAGAALLELGAIVIGLAILARLAKRSRISSAPMYLLAGLALGEGGLLPLVTTRSFVELGAELGLILLLFMLGLEYSARELLGGLRSSPWAGAVDLALNLPPGIVAGLLLGWGIVPALALGGITYVSSSGIVAMLVRDLGRRRGAEVTLIVSLLLIEDLAIAIYLPILAALGSDGFDVATVAVVGAALLAVGSLLWLGLRLEVGISRLLFSRSDEALVLTILGFALALAGAAQLLQISAAVGALLAGILLSGPAAHGAQVLLSPLRDLFAAIFFFFVGLSVDPAAIPPVLGPAVVLAVAGALTKIATGWIAASHARLDRHARLRAGVLLIPRGEFSIAIAGLAVSAGLEPEIAPLAVTYVIALSMSGTIAARFVQQGRAETGPMMPPG